jgi:hypothetical protein
MNIENQGGEHHPDRLDADAVCIQCGTVNAEGTLLCKVCGNNLRDQRNRRMTSDQALEMDRGGPKRRSWASLLVFVLSVGLIVSTLFNQDIIVEWLMDVQGGIQGGPVDLWSGAPGDMLDVLMQDLVENPPTEEAAFAARANPSASGSLEGVYSLFSDDILVGSASVRVDGEAIYFAVLLAGGDQMRGMAKRQSDYYIVVPGGAALESRGDYISIQGVASPQGAGILECVGDDTRDRYGCLAYRLGS